MTRNSLAKAWVCGIAALTLIAMGALSTMRKIEPVRAPADAEARLSVREAQQKYGNLPLRFEKNQGQADAGVRYVSHGSGYELMLAQNEAVLALRQPANRPLASILRLGLDGANTAASVGGVEKLAGRVNYFIGNDPRNWYTDVPSFARVKYTAVYPGVDLVFYGNQRQLEYDFVVSPGADPKSIALRVGGGSGMCLDAQGNLQMSVAGGEVQLLKPYAYQQRNGTRETVAAQYALANGNRVTFNVGKYDSRLPLVLDPVLTYSTYLGGSASGDAGNGIAVDPQGHAYITGVTFSKVFPTVAQSYNPGPLTTNAGGAVFVTEMNPSGTAEVYSTYLSGNVSETGTAIALDARNPPRIYVTGQTLSTNFPTTAGGVIPGPLSTNASGTAFLTTLDPTQTGPAQLWYSTYVGGTAGDIGNGVAVDQNQNAYVTGLTKTSGLATTNAYQSALGSSGGNAFLERIDTTKTSLASLIFYTYLGGSGTGASGGPGAFTYGDAGTGVSVDSASRAYISGVTSSSNFPITATAYQSTSASAATTGTAFFALVDTTMSGVSTLRYSSYLGGTGGDRSLGIALGPNYAAYLTGVTDSIDFPVTTGAFQTTGNASGVAFVTVIDTLKSGAPSLAYSTYLGGSGGDRGNGIAADLNGNAYVTGTTASTNFPVTPGVFESNLRNPLGSAFISKLNPAGGGPTDLTYSTYFGGTGPTVADKGLAIAVDPSSNAYITGSTASVNFPVVALAFQQTLTQFDSAATAAAFVAELPLVAAVSLSPDALTFPGQLVNVASNPQTVTLTNNTSAALNGIVIGVTGANAGDFSTSAGTTACGASLQSGGSCDINVVFTPTAAPPTTETAHLTITDSDPTSPQQMTLSGGVVANAAVVELSPTSLLFSNQIVTGAGSAQTVTLTNKGNIPLTIDSVNISPSDYTETNTCGSSVAAGANCTFSVSFAPTTTGARVGSMTIVSSDNESPHVVALSGTGWNFELTAPTALTVTAGSTGTLTLTVTPLGGFDGTVTVACTNVPVSATCTLSTTTMTFTDGVTAQTSTITLAAKGQIPPPGSGPGGNIQRIVVVMLFALALVFAAASVRMPRQRWSFASVALLLLVLGVSGCGSSATTPQGSYTFDLTGTSGSVTNTIDVALTVN
jgi:Beta-propeller repeat